VYRDAITEKLDAGLSAQRIWQDLVEEFGYGASYEPDLSRFLNENGVPASAKSLTGRVRDFVRRQLAGDVARDSRRFR
jgi:hypothetical protein